MNMLLRAATLVAAASLVWAMPAGATESLTPTIAAAAAGSRTAGAEKLRRLDIMLMVTGLRCRTGEDDFQADFQAFEASHLAELNAAARALHTEYVARFGPRGADRELDRVSTTMANAYGNGHPWLGCHELKQAARMLAEAQGVEPLLAVADELLHGDIIQPGATPAPTLAYAVPR